MKIYADGLNTFKQLMISPATVDRVEKKRRRQQHQQHLALATASKTTTCKIDSYNTVAMKDYKEREWAQEKMSSQETPEFSPYDCSGFTKGRRSWLTS
jgi:hypothetical protein